MINKIKYPATSRLIWLMIFVPGLQVLLAVISKDVIGNKISIQIAAIVTIIITIHIQFRYFLVEIHPDRLVKRYIGIFRPKETVIYFSDTILFFIQLHVGPYDDPFCRAYYRDRKFKEIRLTRKEMKLLAERLEFLNQPIRTAKLRHERPF